MRIEGETSFMGIGGNILARSGSEHNPASGCLRLSRSKPPLLLNSTRKFPSDSATLP